MRLLFAITLIFAVAAVGSVGCGQKTSTPAPKEKDKDKDKDKEKDKGKTPLDEQGKIDITVPTENVKVKQGESVDVDISFARPVTAKGKVSIAVQTVEGLTVSKVPDWTEDKEYTKKIKITADAKKAAPGAHDVKVTATPDGGKAVDATFKVEVVKGAAPPPTGDKSFDFSLSDKTVTIAPGGKKEVTLTVSKWGKDLKGDVSIEAKASEGLTVIPKAAELTPDDKTLKLTITAADDADGKGKVTITALAGEGKVAKEIAVEVKKETPPPPTDEKEFKFGPTKAIEIKPGDMQKVKLGVVRGKDLKGKVPVAVKVDPKLKDVTADLSKKELDDADKELEITIKAAADKSEGEGEIVITATPDGGKAVEAKIKVKVDKGGTPSAQDTSLKISVPGKLELNQDQKKEVTIVVMAGKDLKDKITVEVKPGKGLTADPAKKELATGEKEVKVSITAAKDAGPGTVEVAVTASAGTTKAGEKITVEVKKGADKQETFKFEGPKKVEVTQGKDAEVKIKVERSKDFKEKINFTIKADKGLKPLPEKVELAADKAEFTFKVMAEADAKVGPANVEVTATAGGQPATFTIAVDVKKKE